MKVIKTKRNYGIDLLRILSMLFVVLLHSYGQGGILANVTPGTMQYKCSWMVEIIAFCAVNIFALISGYVMYDKKDIKLSSYINLWFQVVFYGLIVTLIFDIADTTVATRSDYIRSILPVTKNLYWYFTAYTGLFFLIPFLDKAITNLSNTALKKYFIIIIAVFSVYDTITNKFNLSLGYSVMWLLLVYILGAILKKCEIAKKVKTYKLVLMLIGLYLITFLYKMYGFEFNIIEYSITKSIFINYTSPTILGVAVLYVLIFSRLKFCSIFEKIIKFAAPSAFTIYLLNNHALIWQYVISGMFSTTATRSVIVILVYTFGFSIAFVVISILIDRVRIQLFKVLKIQTLSIKIQNIIYYLINKTTLLLK